MISRSGHTFKQWPYLDVEIAHSLRCDSAILDGEIGCLDNDGRSNFHKLLFRREWPHFFAVESMAKPRFMIGKIPPTPGLVDQFFNDSTGAGEDGEIDARGPWNEGGDWTRVEAPAFPERQEDETKRMSIDDRTTNTSDIPDELEALLADTLRDLLSAEGQPVKALPKMADAANAKALQVAFETHLEQTKEHVKG